MAENRKEPTRVPPRLLFINVLLSGFVSLVVFVICAYVFVIPRLLDHERRLKAHDQTLDEITQPLPEEDAAEDEADEAPSAPAAPAGAAP